MTLPWQRKSFVYLILAAVAVSGTGLSFKSSPSLPEALVISLCTIALVLFVYGFDDLMDDGKLRTFIKSPKLWSLVSFGLVALIISYAFLGVESFWSAAFVLTSGLFYSITFEYKKTSFKLKSVAWLKNILIGVGWGALIFLGAGSVETLPILISALFLTLQVIIGSIIRDLDDIEEDRQKSVNTLPVALGFKKTITYTHGLNLLSLFILLAALIWCPQQNILWMLWIFAVIYRATMIAIIGRRHEDSFFMQPVNIATCGLIFFLRLVYLWIS